MIESTIATATNVPIPTSRRVLLRDDLIEHLSASDRNQVERYHGGDRR